MSKLKIEDALLLAGLKLNPTDDAIQHMDELVQQVNDWDYFLRHAIQHCVGPFLHKNLLLIPNHQLVPNTVAEKLKQTYLKTLSRNMIIYEHFRNAIPAFSSQGISVIAMKGIFMADTVYDDIGLRQMSDIDLLTRNRAEAEKCRTILIGMGYSYNDIHHTGFSKQFSDAKHLPPMVLNGVSIELHTKVHLDNPDYLINIDDYRERSRQVQVFGTPVLALAPTDLVQHICIHLDDHFNSGKIQLTSYCDITAALNFYKNDFNWKLLEDSCNKFNCQKNVYSHLFLAKKYFNADVPDAFIKQAEQYIHQKYENLFIHYIQFNYKSITDITGGYQMKALNKIRGIQNKIFFVLGSVFPDRSFMYKRYAIRNKPLIFWFYGVRIGKAHKALFVYLRNRVMQKEAL